MDENWIWHWLSTLQEIQRIYLPLAIPDKIFNVLPCSPMQSRRLILNPYDFIFARQPMDFICEIMFELFSHSFFFLQRPCFFCHLGFLCLLCHLCCLCFLHHLCLLCSLCHLSLLCRRVLRQVWCWYKNKNKKLWKLDKNKVHIVGLLTEWYKHYFNIKLDPINNKFGIIIKVLSS